MAFESNVKPKLIGIYDDLYVTHFPANNLGSYIKRNQLSNAHHLAKNLVNHPTLDNVVNCLNGHAFLKGSIRVEWEWNNGEITESQIDNYLAEIPPNLPNYTFIKNLSENKLIADIDTNWQSDNWINNHINWQIASPVAKVILNSVDAEFLCVTRLNGSYTSYTFENRTISPNETVTLSRPDCEKCFLIFSDSLVSGDKTLNPYKAYKLVNTSLTLTNNSNNYIKVLRYTK